MHEVGAIEVQLEREGFVAGRSVPPGRHFVEVNEPVGLDISTSPDPRSTERFEPGATTYPPTAARAVKAVLSVDVVCVPATEEAPTAGPPLLGSP